ncbi:hypothetical protein J6590_020954 [Homalodisca vitripennis]|nr:hypothetical protein J6590_020954 [Homalodisca vitripennis]
MAMMGLTEEYAVLDLQVGCATRSPTLHILLPPHTQLHTALNKLYLSIHPLFGSLGSMAPSDPINYKILTQEKSWANWVDLALRGLNKMESMPPLETVYQAVFALYRNPDTAEKEKASMWLNDLQRSVLSRGMFFFPFVDISDGFGSTFGRRHSSQLDNN